MLPALCRPAFKNLSNFLRPNITTSQLDILLLKVNKNQQILPESIKYASTSHSKEFTFPTRPYKLHKLQNGPSANITLTTEQVRKFLTEMTIIRRIEMATAALYKSKTVRGFCHLYIGQEAIAVGMHSQLTNADAVITSYRCHAWAYLCGLSTHHLLAELCAKETGNVRGKGGSMHMYTSTFYGGNGIVGAQGPLGTGIALSMMYQKKDSVMIVLYGDGAANQGQLFEAYNIAKLWNLPVIFVCENNQYGMGTSTKRSAASVDYYTRGDYIPGIYVDGMDVLTVCAASKFAVNYVKSGNGPIVLEMNTYRYYGHSMSDPGTSYRNKAEVTEVRKTRDPITLLKNQITTQEILTEDEMKSIEKEAKVHVDAVVKQCMSDPVIKVEELAYDIYKNPLEPDVRGILPWTRMKYKNIGKRNERKRE